ncbi:MAG: PadR family transcriptional regulator [Candidatus Ranarchaeia archaeon]
MGNHTEVFRERMNRELKRGANALLILHVLAHADRPIYGYEVITLLNNVSQNKVGLGPGTIYPLMKRLQKLQFVESKWAPPEQQPDAVPRKYYTLTPKGYRLYKLLLSDWKNLTQIMQTILNKNNI